MKHQKSVLFLLVLSIAAFVLSPGCERDPGGEASSLRCEVIIEPGALLPFRDNGDLIWKPSDFDSLYLHHWQQEEDYVAVISETEKKSDIETFVEILSGIEKTLIYVEYTERTRDSLEKTSEQGVLPEEIGEIIFHFGPFLPGSAFLQVFKAADCGHLWFRLENSESEVECYHHSVYRISLEDFEKLENFLDGLEKKPVSKAAKPVLYLYPEHESEVSVKLHFEGFLDVTYPAYKDGWNVRAYPDGHLVNLSDNREYSYLFWEGTPWDANWDFGEGYCIPGADTASFLQQKLGELGMIPKEYNEFIVYWLPQMQNNPYNLITFQWDEYERVAPLEIDPEPDSVLRVFMVFAPLQNPVEIPPPPKRPAFVRRGFAVVEWGASKAIFD